MKITQNPECPLFLFTLTGDELLRVADISRIGRERTGRLVGYQRPVQSRHVRNIAEYLDSGAVLFPNSLILAFSSRVRFKADRHKNVSDRYSTTGVLEIPLPEKGRRKPAWIVDGQQRAMALAKCKNSSLPVPVNGFVAPNEDRQREQFLRVNSTKPLPRGLITELLPEIDSVLPSNLALRRTPAALCNLLNTDFESPFFSLIRQSSTPPGQRRAAVVADTAIVRMLQDSLNSPNGCLFAYRNIATNETDIYGIRRVLVTYWSAVHDVFRDAWGLPPSRSRLMHSAGLRAMGRLMDKVMRSVSIDNPGARRFVRRELAPLRQVCHWTSGSWKELGGLAWNEIQNVPSHVRMLSGLLVRSYLQVEESTA